jgi:predicted lipid-binding transport protein (Tim44 family)
MMAGFFAGTVFGAFGFSRAGFWSLLPLTVVLAGLVWWASRGHGPETAPPSG